MKNSTKIRAMLVAIMAWSQISIAEVLSYKKQAELAGAAFSYPTTTKLVLTKLMDFCGHKFPSITISAAGALKKWQDRNNIYLLASVNYRNAANVLIQDSNPAPALREQIRKILEVDFPIQLAAKVESVLAPLRVAAENGGGESKCLDYIIAIGFEKYDIAQSAPQLADFMNKNDPRVIFNHIIQQSTLDEIRVNTPAQVAEAKQSVDVEYVAALRRKIKSNIIYAPDEEIIGNPKASFKVRLFPNGEIMSVDKMAGSGLQAYDAALANAIRKSSPFPKKRDGTVERLFVLDFAMKDLLQMTKAQPGDFSQNGTNRLMAEMSGLITRQLPSPKKTFISPSTRDVGHAMYYISAQRKIERFGTLNFPSANGMPLYGRVIVVIPIYQDGSIYEKEGGPRVAKTSGKDQLDKLALDITRQSAPFDKIPDKLRSQDRDDVWVLFAIFNFMNDKENLEIGNEGQSEF